MRLVEPKVIRNGAPQSLEFFVSEQECLKAGYLYIFNNAFNMAAYRSDFGFLSQLNLSRVSEDVYLEVKTRKEELKVDEYVQGKIKAYSFNPQTIDAILAILELKYDLDEDV